MKSKVSKRAKCINQIKIVINVRFNRIEKTSSSDVLVCFAIHFPSAFFFIDKMFVLFVSHTSIDFHFAFCYAAFLLLSFSFKFKFKSLNRLLNEQRTHTYSDKIGNNLFRNLKCKLIGAICSFGPLTLTRSVSLTFYLVRFVCNEFSIGANHLDYYLVQDSSHNNRMMIVKANFR